MDVYPCSKDVTSLQRAKGGGREVAVFPHFPRSQEWHIHRYGFITILVLDTKGPQPSKKQEKSNFVICYEKST